jgi:hypothetical protein
MPPAYIQRREERESEKEHWNELPEPPISLGIDVLAEEERSVRARHENVSYPDAELACKNRMLNANNPTNISQKTNRRIERIPWRHIGNDLPPNMVAPRALYAQKIGPTMAVIIALYTFCVGPKSGTRASVYAQISPPPL